MNQSEPSGGPIPARKKWRYPGIEIPFRLQDKYWDFSKGPDPRTKYNSYTW